MRELSLHILDIAENSVSAGASKVSIKVVEDLRTDRLEICVQDNGKGMDSARLAQVCDPFFTSRTTRKVGLGIPFLKAAAEGCQGKFSIDSAPGKGACVRAEFKHSHIDRMPMGDLAGTLLTLLVSFPDTHWIFDYEYNGAKFEFDDGPVKEALNGVPLTEPKVLANLRSWIEQGLIKARQNENDYVINEV